MNELVDIETPYLSKLEGKYYESDSKGLVKNLVLITTAGDCSLSEILKIRSNENNPYNEEEIVKIFDDLLEGLYELKKKRIYHSDIKPLNIVLNKSHGCYMLIDFGVSQIVPIQDEEGKIKNCWNLCELGTGGSKQYFSPEKSSAFPKLEDENFDIKYDYHSK